MKISWLISVVFFPMKINVTTFLNIQIKSNWAQNLSRFIKTEQKISNPSPADTRKSGSFSNEPDSTAFSTACCCCGDLDVGHGAWVQQQKCSEWLSGWYRRGVPECTGTCPRDPQAPFAVVRLKCRPLHHRLRIISISIRWGSPRGEEKSIILRFSKSVRNSLVGPHKKEGEKWRAKRVCGFLFGVLYRSRRDAVLQWCKSAHKTGLARCFWTVEGADRMRWMKNLCRAYFSSLPEEGFIQGHTYIRTYTHTCTEMFLIPRRDALVGVENFVFVRGRAVWVVVELNNAISRS